MVRTDDDETPWTRQLLVGLAALVVVALVIGGVISVLAVGAARVSGIDSSRPAASAPPSVYLPSGDPTTGLDTYPDPSGRSSPSASATSSPSPSATPTKKKPRLITLQVSPKRVAPGARITLTGRHRGRAGAQLQVQRFESGWADFPVTVRVRDGRFSTYIITSRTGATRLRVLDIGTGKTSNQVRVTVG